MKAVINQLAQARPDIVTRESFETAYKAKHPNPEILSAENIRQAFEQFKSQARKILRVKRSREGTVGPDRIPR